MDVKLTVRGGVFLGDRRPRDKVSVLVGQGPEVFRSDRKRKNEGWSVTHVRKTDHVQQAGKHRGFQGQWIRILRSKPCFI